jgi:hypothetical protein
MNTLLQIFGSLASIGAIPLAVYLYLRSREARLSKLRQEICKVISYQIGEGRNLSTFEVQAVIDSKLREHKFKPDAVSLEEVVEDLVTETITNPMLESEKKKIIIENLQKIHRAGQIHKIVMRYSITPIDFIESVSKSLPLSSVDLELLKAKEKLAEVKEAVFKQRPALVETLSTLFALVAALAGIIGFVIGEVSIKKFIGFFF